MAAGGRLAPQLPSLITFDSQKLGHSTYYQRCSLQPPTNSEKENDLTFNTWKPSGKNEKFPRYLKKPKNLKSSEKNEIHAVGYSTCQQLEKNNKKNLERMREILGAYRKKTITRKSVLWNFRKSISDWCINCQVTWPLRINNPFRNRSINRLIRAIFKKIDFFQNRGRRSEFHRSIHFSTITQTVDK